MMYILIILVHIKDSKYNNNTCMKVHIKPDSYLRIN